VNTLITRRCLALGLLMLHATTALAQRPEVSGTNAQEDAGWSGYLQLLAGGSRSDGAAVYADDNAQIASLSAPTREHDADFLLPLWQLRYRLPGNGITLFAGMPEQGIIENEATVEVGARYALANDASVWLAYGPGLSLYRKQVWKDPFLTGEKRAHTDTETQALRLGADYILGSPVSVTYAMGDISVKDEQSGQSLSGRLSSADIDDLRRSGTLSQTRISLTLPMTARVFIIPELIHTQRQTDGEAHRYHSPEARLALAYLADPWEVYVHGYVGKDNYRHEHPVFGTKREDTRTGFTAGVSYSEPLGWRDLQANVVVGNAVVDSTIPFYDATVQVVTMGLTWRY